MVAACIVPPCSLSLLLLVMQAMGKAAHRQTAQIIFTSLVILFAPILRSISCLAGR